MKDPNKKQTGKAYSWKRYRLISWSRLFIIPIPLLMIWGSPFPIDPRAYTWVCIIGIIVIIIISQYLMAWLCPKCRYYFFISKYDERYWDRFMFVVKKCAQCGLKKFKDPES